MAIPPRPSTSSSALAARIAVEMRMLTTEPPPSISCWPVDDSLINFEAVILGVDGTPYEKGEFKVSITLPLRYPWEPPKCRFLTKVYHPNIDEGGRICLDTLHLPPKGSWKPSLNLSIVLQSLRLLLGTPNPEDPLVAHVTDEFQNNYSKYAEKARFYTIKYATTREASSIKPSVLLMPDASQDPDLSPMKLNQKRESTWVLADDPSSTVSNKHEKDPSLDLPLTIHPPAPLLKHSDHSSSQIPFVPLKSAFYQLEESSDSDEDEDGEDPNINIHLEAKKRKITQLITTIDPFELSHDKESC